MKTPFSPTEKLLLVAKQLSDKFALYPDSKGATILVKDIIGVSQPDAVGIIRKFEEELGIISLDEDMEVLEHKEDKSKSSVLFVLSKEKGFDEYLDKLLMEERTKSNSPTDAKALWLSYDNKRRLVLNDVFLITKTRENYQNDRLLKFLLENPNKEFSKKELLELNVLLKKGDKVGSGEALKADEDKDFNVLIQDIKFGEELKELFFPKKYFSADTILLKNPILFKDLKERGVDLLDLNKLLKFKAQD